MRQLHLTILCFLAVAASFCQDHAKYTTKDLANLKSLVTKWDRYWNTHDMDSMGTLLRDDVDFINVAGQWLKGKKETVAVHKERHLVVFKNSIFESYSVAIKYIKSDLAILHIEWGITGDVDPDGKPRSPRRGIFTWVVTKKNNHWLILAVHNVNIRETGAFMNAPESK
jgi:uncharacterized protein (TIGR02246 family)